MRKEGKMRLRKCLIIVAFIVFALACFSCLLLSYNPEDYFPLQQGNEWTYAFTLNGNTLPSLEVFIDGTDLVNGVETIKYNMSSPVPNEYDYFCYTIDSEGLKQHKWYWATFGTYSIFDSPRIEIPSNFKWGEVHEESLSYTTYNIDDNSLVGTFTGSETVTFESIEDVTVPAGTFNNCLKVSIALAATLGDWTQGFDEILWLAHGVGMVKHHTTNYERNAPASDDYEVVITHELTDYNVETP